MDDCISAKKKYLEDTISHKKYFFDSAYKISIYFLENDNEKMALDILRRAFVHDYSKLSSKEFNSFLVFEDYNNSLRDASVLYKKEEEVFLKEHWKNNKHHPEYWDNPSKMQEIDIVEMVCDWHARSVEYGTDLKEFVKTRQHNRFQFSDEMYEKINKYIEILLK